MNSRILKFT